MSLGALTTLAAVRDTRAPTKQDLGKATGPDQGKESASLTDILVTQVPTELVAPYTAITAAIVGAVAKPTPAMPNPDQLGGWRWLAFAILIVATVVLVWEGTRRKAGGGAFPLLAITGAVAAATGWAFALPGSPLTPYLHGPALVLTPLIVAFAAVAVTAMTASALQVPRGGPAKSAGPGTDGAGTDGTTADGPVTDGPATDEAAPGGTATDGSATDGSATDGPATDQAAPGGTATDGSATDGPAADGAAADGSDADGSDTGGAGTNGSAPGG